MIFVLSISNIAVAQTRRTNTSKGNISGTIIDAKTSTPLPYVSVAIMKISKDSTIVNGGITDDNGVFKIKDVTHGKYIIKASFVGYKDFSKTMTVSANSTNLGTIKLEPTSENLQEVQIVGAKQMMEYKLDKRVINVDQNLVSTGGDASDVLQDVPSVEVDDEGNISLRGASNVTLLIDGKPSSLYGSDVSSVLAQIPASQIDKVEVITNPSAKYNPEGMSGIINITLKEKGNMGLNGNVNLSGGTALREWQPRSNGAVSLNWSNKKFSLSSSADFHYGDRSMETDNLRAFHGANNTTSDLIRSKRNGGDKSLGYGINLSGEWYINKYNTLGLNFNTHRHNSFDDYSTTKNRNLLKDIDERNNNDISSGDGDGSFNNVGVTYQKEFKDRKDQLFYASGTWSWGSFNRSIEDDIEYLNDEYTDYVRGDTNKSHHNHAIVDIHYVQPFSETSKLEIGYNLNYSHENSKNRTSYDAVLDNVASYDFIRDEYINAFYATYGFQIGEKLSAQLGLRQEIVTNDFTKTDLNNEEIKFDKDYNPLYPTIHLSYQLNRNNAFQLSYSRRIRRPDPWTMMPNIDRTNKEYLRFGNPDIDPEYTNAFELGWSLMFKNTTIFTSAYYRGVSNGMTRFQFLWNEENAERYGFQWAWASAHDEASINTTAQTFVNLAHSSNYGLEVIIDRDITNWWKANLSMNFFGSYQDGTDLSYDEVYSFNFNSKLNTTFTLPFDMTIQLAGRYTAPRKTIQGRDNARYDVDIAIKKSILNKQGNIALNFRDVFDTRGGFGYAYTDEYVSFTRRHPYSQSIRLSFSYNFGKTANMKRNKIKQQHVEDNYSSGSSTDSEE